MSFQFQCPKMDVLVFCFVLSLFGFLGFRDYNTFRTESYFEDHCHGTCLNSSSHRVRYTYLHPCYMSPLVKL